MDEMSVLMAIKSGGFFVKFILFFLLLLSTISWSIIFLKFFQMKHILKENKLFNVVYKNSESIKKIIENTTDLQRSTLKNIFTEVYKELQEIKKNFVDNKNISIKEIYNLNKMTFFERSIDKEIINQENKILDSLHLLATISSSAPYIGLLGTVWGIMDAFSLMKNAQGQILTLIAPAIAEALVATGVGLFVAIPSLWFFNYYTNKISLLSLQHQEIKNEYLNLVERSIFSQYF